MSWFQKVKLMRFYTAGPANRNCLHRASWCPGRYALSGRLVSQNSRWDGCWRLFSSPVVTPEPIAIFRVFTRRNVFLDIKYNATHDSGRYFTVYSLYSCSTHTISKPYPRVPFFFGAFSDICNAPNFMVRSIAEEAGTSMSSFFGYILKYSLLFLIPRFGVATIISF